MNIKFWRKQQKRSVDTGAGAGKAIQARLPSVPSQPIDVTSTNSAMQLAAVYRCVSILSGTIAHCRCRLRERKTVIFLLIVKTNCIAY
jgi:phage portal protein BeeE